VSKTTALTLNVPADAQEVGVLGSLPDVLAVDGVTARAITMLLSLYLEGRAMRHEERR
jgi:hypothetical protein